MNIIKRACDAPPRLDHQDDLDLVCCEEFIDPTISVKTPQIKLINCHICANCGFIAPPTDKSCIKCTYCPSYINHY